MRVTDSCQPLRVDCLAFPETLAAELRPLAAAAAANLDLQQHLSALILCPDDLPGQDEAWFHLSPAPAGADILPELFFYCHGAVFGKPEPARSTVIPPPESWDGWHTAAPTDLLANDAFSPQRSEVFLHHNLLLARDVMSSEVVPATIPTALSEAFQAIWAVTVDGRLSRRGLPGYTLAERRGVFSRLFSTAGVLLPDHWQLFQSLWDGASAGQRDVLDLVRRLPRL